MCTKIEEQTDSSNFVKNGDLSVSINNQQIKYYPTNLNDSRSVDFRLNTNIKFTSDKKMRICFVINILVSVMCTTASLIISYKLYSDLIQVRNEIVSLNAKLESLSESCEKMQIQQIEQISYEVPTSTSEQNISLEENKLNMKDGDGNYEQTILTRLPRANRRNKENSSRRKVKSSGALAAHFKGSVPEIFVKDQGLVGPWYLDNSVSKQYKFPKFHLTEGQCSIEVTEPALYLIYAQVYYITSSTVNSYSVVVRSEGSSENNIIAKCSTVGLRSSHAVELSCYTATVCSLKANDRIFIQQTERNRTIILRDGHSFFGLVRLNNSHQSHRNQKH